MKKICFLIVIVVSLSACSYTGYLEKDFHNVGKPLEKKINLSAAILNTQELRDFRVQEYTGGRDFTFYFNPAFSNALVKELKNIFLDAALVDTSADLLRYDIQIVPVINYTYKEGTAWTGQYRYEFTVALSARDAKTAAPVEDFKNTQEVIISPSAANNALGFLTGLSLFLLSPITMPAITQEGGNNARRILEENMSRSIKALSFQIANSTKICNYKN
ncbi:MAG TPA: hypothetical protein PK022_02520 [Syntrophales bacterium]|nr:hypothetical protein [Syntrophales bacterium]